MLTDCDHVRARIDDRTQVNLNVSKRKRYETKSPHDYPSPICSDTVQIVPFTQNIVTSKTVLERKTDLDNVELNFINRMALGFRKCEHFLHL